MVHIPGFLFYVSLLLLKLSFVHRPLSRLFSIDILTVALPMTQLYFVLCAGGRKGLTGKAG
jgi:hypothetical protein